MKTQLSPFYKISRLILLKRTIKPRPFKPKLKKSFFFLRLSGVLDTAESTSNSQILSNSKSSVKNGSGREIWAQKEIFDEKARLQNLAN
jgi:hypothetical protein